MYTNEVQSYTTKVLKKLDLDREFQDRFRTTRGDIILQHIPSKHEFIVPSYWMLLIEKHRGPLQAAALLEFKKLVKNYTKLPSFPQ